MKYTDSYYNIYKNLPEKLVEIYPDLNFENHCYLRIALDTIFKTKWDIKMNRPAYKNLNKSQLEELLTLLNQYKTDKELLLKHNKQSLLWRKNLKDLHKVSNQQNLWHNN